jgi:prophage antirepressor-like protein
MLDKNQCLINEFEDFNVNTVLFDGKPCWITKDIGNVLGYAKKGKGLIELISREWSDEFIKGEHIDILSGQELSDFKKVLDVVASNATTSAPKLSILYEPGINLVCLNTQKPVGKRLRRLISTVVMPSIRKTGTYSLPGVKEDSQGTAQFDDQIFHLEKKIEFEKVVLEKFQSEALLREKDVMLREQDVILKDKENDELNRKIDSISNLFKYVSGEYDDKELELQLYIVKLRTGQDFSPMFFNYEEPQESEPKSEYEEPKPQSLPPIQPEPKYQPQPQPQPEEGKWYSPSEIGKALGISAYHVGFVITDLKLRKPIPGMTSVTEKKDFNGKNFKYFVYSKKAFEKISEKYHTDIVRYQKSFKNSDKN